MPDTSSTGVNNAGNAGRLGPVLLKGDLAREGQKLDSGSFDAARLALGSDESRINQTA